MKENREMRENYSIMFICSLEQCNRKGDFNGPKEREGSWQEQCS